MERKTLSQEAYEKIKQNLEDGVYQGYINGRQVARDLILVLLQSGRHFFSFRVRD